MDGKDRKDVGETYSFTTNDQDRTIIAHFKEGIMGNVKFVIPDTIRVNGKDEKGNFKNAISIKPDDMDNVRSFTIPTNYTLFKNIKDDGTASEKEYTLKYWVKQGDDTNKKYKLGYTYSFSTEGETITLVPVFEENSSTQDNRVNDPLIRYDFARKVKEYEDASTESSTDPSTKEAKKVSAQTVNIGKNKQMFWTSKVWVKVRENSVDSEHWRDVALWCDTGKKGYIRNEQFDNWCAFGPGTTFWFPTGTDAKISLMSYSKITTTTIDDSVPTLDRERTNIERKKVGLPSLEEEEKGAESYMYVFHSTSRKSDVPTILKGNPTSEYISSDNNNGYVLSYKSTWGLGFYKYTGSQLSPYRAWLPQNMVSKSNEEDLALGKQAIHLVFAKGTSGILPPTIQRDQEEEKLFNLSGQQVEKTTKGLVITRKKGKFIKK